MPCLPSLLGFHLSSGIKEKIWNDEFLNLLSLLPSSKEFLRQDREKHDDDRRRPVARSFNNWLQVFCMYASVMCEKYPENRDKTSKCKQSCVILRTRWKYKSVCRQNSSHNTVCISDVY